MTARDMRVYEILQEEIPNLSPDNLDASFESLGVDSFGLVSLRARIETETRRQIDDRLWTSAESPADLVKIASSDRAVADPRTRPGAGERRTYNLNMPQMALCGLSESWLFKELGDLHWSMIAKGLECRSSELRDGSGARLYATFTRISLTLDRPLLSFRENDPFKLDGNISRFGAGIFLSNVDIGPGGSATIMSSFSRRGAAGSNQALLKGQPHIPPDCRIVSLAEQPEFGREYLARRSVSPSPPLFECEYEIVPQHDINGVGLLYFAAYPLIADICEMQHSGREFAYRYSTRNRDVFYFNNSDPDETLIYRVHACRRDESENEIESSISRKSDDVTMANLVTIKDVVDG